MTLYRTQSLREFCALCTEKTLATGACTRCRRPLCVTHAHWDETRCDLCERSYQPSSGRRWQYRLLSSLAAMAGGALAALPGSLALSVPAIVFVGAWAGIAHGSFRVCWDARIQTLKVASRQRFLAERGL